MHQVLNKFVTMVFTRCNEYMKRHVDLCNPSLLLARIIFWRKYSGSMRKNFVTSVVPVGFEPALSLWECQVSNKENKI